MEKRMSIYNPVYAEPPQVALCDVTLRDGEQTAGVAFSLDEKREIARRLDEIGVEQIQLASPLYGKKNKAEASALVAMGLKADIEVMSHSAVKNWQESIRAAVESGADVVHSLIPVSRLMRGMFKPSLNDEQILERAYESVVYAKKIGAPAVNISLLDATRTDPKYIVQITEVLMDAGVDRIRFADTVGTASSEGIRVLTENFVKTIKEHAAAQKPKLCVHLHNDFGLATANSFAAVQSGVEMIDVTVNGLGERSGNPDLAQVATGLGALYDIKTSIILEKLQELSEFVAKLSGIPIPSNHPLTGSMVFADESNSHVMATAKDPFAFQGIKASAIGNRHRTIMGNKSGVESVSFKLKEMGYGVVDAAFAEEALKALLVECDKRKGNVISDEEFLGIVNRIKLSREAKNNE